MDGSDRPHKVANNGERISGSGHFAVQVMRQSKDQHLPFILEDKSDSFHDRYEQGDPKNQQVALYPGDDKLQGDVNRISRMGREVHYSKKQRGGSKPSSKCNVDFYEVCSISTIGNGTHFDREVPSGNTGGGNHDKKVVSFQSDVILDQPWVIQQCPNEPHPLLEFPPLYWMVRGRPGVLAAIKHIYSYRWRMSYPLQRRIFLSQHFKKAGIFCTIGELLLVLPLAAIFVGGLLFAFVWPSTFWSGHVARLPLILALATAMRNSIITLLIGLPFERGRSTVLVLLPFACFAPFRLVEFISICLPRLIEYSSLVPQGSWPPGFLQWHPPYDCCSC
jgi:hypothetical protein